MTPRNTAFTGTRQTAALVVLPAPARAQWLKEHHAREALTRNGHSAFKAQAILRGCRRGDRYALAWLLAMLPSDAPVPATD